jgi:GntR family transcriptional regulator
MTRGLCVCSSRPILRARIESGEITARLPSERDLHNEFGPAPMTVRKAVRLLVDDGLVVVVPGRGTYVVKKDQN